MCFPVWFPYYFCCCFGFGSSTRLGSERVVHIIFIHHVFKSNIHDNMFFFSSESSYMVYKCYVYHIYIYICMYYLYIYTSLCFLLEHTWILRKRGWCLCCQRCRCSRGNSDVEWSGCWCFAFVGEVLISHECSLMIFNAT